MLTLDNLIVGFNRGLRTLFNEARSARPYSDAGLSVEGRHGQTRFLICLVV